MSRKDSIPNAMMTCPKCGFFNPAGETVCQLCGSPLSQSFQPVAASAAQDVVESAPAPLHGDASPAFPENSITRTASGLVVCPQCGFENDPELDYCEKCFGSLKVLEKNAPESSAPGPAAPMAAAAPIAEPAVAANICPICGQANGRGDQYCLRCGAPLSAVPGGTKEPQKKKEKAPKPVKAPTAPREKPTVPVNIPVKPILIGVSALVIIALLLLVLLHGGGNRKNKPMPTNTTDVAATVSPTGVGTGTVVSEQPSERPQEENTPVPALADETPPAPTEEVPEIAVIAITEDVSDLQGFENDLMFSIVQELGVDYEFHFIDPEELLPAIESGEADFAIGGIELTRERQTFLDASDCYYTEQIDGKEVGYAIFMRKGSEWTDKVNAVLHKLTDKGRVESMQEFWKLIRNEEDEYLLPHSADAYVTKEDLQKLTWEECCFARNEIYARHGRIFATPQIAEYFESKSWYKGTIPGATFDANQSSYLNSYESSNVAFILNYERSTWGRSYY